MIRSHKEFIVYPAIDLHDGKVVRLVQGDLAQQKIYSNEPDEVAHRWLSSCAAVTQNTPRMQTEISSQPSVPSPPVEHPPGNNLLNGSTLPHGGTLPHGSTLPHWLHIVNLDGAFGSESPANRQALISIMNVCESFQANIQFGGGLHTLEAIEQALSLGIRRVLLGTIAVQHPEMVLAALEHFGPDRIGVALDAREGRLRVHGWKKQTDTTALELGHDLYSAGVRTVIYTNIARDGTGQGVDIMSATTLSEKTKLNVIASGGVNALEEVRQAKLAGLAGIIIGRALYEGLIDLQEALLC